MDYLPTLGETWPHSEVNIPYMDPMGYNPLALT